MAVERLKGTEIFAFRELARADGWLTGRAHEMAAFQKRGIAEPCISTRDRSQRAWRLTQLGRALAATLDK